MSHLALPPLLGAALGWGRGADNRDVPSYCVVGARLCFLCSRGRVDREGNVEGAEVRVAGDDPFLFDLEGGRTREVARRVE